MRRNVFISRKVGPSPARAVVERARDGVLDREHVVAVDHLAGHPVAGGPVGEVGDRPQRPPVGRERELVVLADEDDRQLPGRSQVHPLVHRALAGGAVAEEGDRDLAGAAQLRGQRGAAGVRDAGADDPVAAEDVEREVGDVHRAAEPLAVAGALAEHLGHHPAEIRARRDQVPVRAVVPDEVVGVAHHARGADRDRLLADAAVRRAEDHALLEELGRAVLEAPDQLQQPVLLEQRSPVGRPVAERRRHGGRRRSRLGWPLVEFDDVAVRIERVEALAAAVRAFGRLLRAVRAEGDAARLQVGIELFDARHEDAEVPGAVVARPGGARVALAALVLDQLDVEVAAGERAPSRCRARSCRRR